MTTGVCGAILKRILGIPLIVQVMTSPKHVGFANHPHRRLRDYAAQAWSDICLHLSLLSADRVQLLAPNLLAHYPLLRRVRYKVFHDFVAASRVPAADPQKSSTVLLVGAPWHLKGADLLLKAFLKVSPSRPNARLKLLGHYPDINAVKDAIANTPEIEILRAVSGPKALEIISKAAVVALPSRCEGLPRVLIEAMSAGLPVVASEVGGIPHLLRHGENGFLVPVGDVDTLADSLRKLLDDPALRQRMGQAGKDRAMREFTEQRYVDHFTEMVRETVQEVEEETVRGVR